MVKNLNIFVLMLFLISPAFAQEEFDELQEAEAEVSQEQDFSFEDESSIAQDQDVEALLEEEFREEGDEAVQTENEIPEESVTEQAQEDLMEPVEESVLESEAIAQPEEAVGEEFQEEMHMNEMVEEFPEPQMDQNFQEEQPMVMDASTDEPDYGYEQHLAQIYSQFYSEPLSEAQWAQVFQNSQSENYNIQKGDSLWNISATLFGDGQYWPKVWSTNGGIENPHKIKEGNTIRFLLGNESEAPSVSIADGTLNQGTVEGEAPLVQGVPENSVVGPQGTYEGDSGEVSSSVTESPKKAQAETEYYSEADNQPDIAIPPPTIVSRPALRVLPPSLPELMTRNKELYDNVGMSFGRRAVFELDATVDLNYILMAEIPKPEAKVVEVELGGEAAGPMQYIFIEPLSASLKVGDRLVAYESSGVVEYEGETMYDSRAGHSIKYLGEVRVLERVQSIYKDKLIYKALVEKAMFPVKKNSFLRLGQVERVVLSKKNMKIKNIRTTIIGGEYTIRREFFSANNIIYLNEGHKVGVQEGDVLPVRMNRVHRYNSTIDNDGEVIGYIKIVKVEANMSTGIVISASKDIRIYDVTGLLTNVAAQ